jgi:hypothetical protein
VWELFLRYEFGQYSAESNVKCNMDGNGEASVRAQSHSMVTVNHDDRTLVFAFRLAFFFGRGSVWSDSAAGTVGASGGGVTKGGCSTLAACD